MGGWVGELGACFVLKGGWVDCLPFEGVAWPDVGAVFGLRRELGHKDLGKVSGWVNG